MSDELPKQELLIKLLGMTGSANDGEALNAIRKANGLLSAAGWTWERLIHGKIRVIEDPFKTMATPRATETLLRAAPPPPAKAPKHWTPKQPMYKTPPSFTSPGQRYSPAPSSRRAGPSLDDL